MKRIVSDRKTLYFILCVVSLCVVSLTVVYAALSTILEISGNADVIASNWNVHFDNVKVLNGSCDNSVPNITSPTTVDFSFELSKPGDFYRFNIDVVNNGTIDAMIDSVIKTKDLTDEQKKFLKFDISYADGVAIDSKQLLAVNSSKSISVEVMYRRDISVNELQTSNIDINLEISLIYTQASDSNIETAGGGYSPSMLRFISGDLYTVGSEVCFYDDCFYVIANDGVKIKLLTKYSITINADSRQNISSSTIKFASSRYWYDGSNLKEEYGSGYPAYVYNSRSVMYTYINSYKTYLEGLGLVIDSARLINKSELDSLGCSRNTDSCSKALPFVYSISYWSGTATTHSYILTVKQNGDYVATYMTQTLGIRPVIEIFIDNI